MGRSAIGRTRKGAEEAGKGGWSGQGWMDGSSGWLLLGRGKLKTGRMRDTGAVGQDGHVMSSVIYGTINTTMSQVVSRQSTMDKEGYTDLSCERRHYRRSLLPPTHYRHA
jgi:hypothetical protein